MTYLRIFFVKSISLLNIHETTKNHREIKSKYHFCKFLLKATDIQKGNEIQLSLCLAGYFEYFQKRTDIFGTFILR